VAEAVQLNGLRISSHYNMEIIQLNSKFLKGLSINYMWSNLVMAFFFKVDFRFVKKKQHVVT